MNPYENTSNHPEDQYEWANQNPFLKIQLTEHGYNLPPTVLAEVFRNVRTMVNTFHFDGTPANDMNYVAATFEESTITIGFSQLERKALKEWHADQAAIGEPVAVWNSGMSIGCTQYLFWLDEPDAEGSHFYWTIP